MTLVLLMAACVASPEPRLEASPSVEVAVGATSPTPAAVESTPNSEAAPDLYLLDPRTGETTLFLSEPGTQTNAEVSPDGRQVVYESRAPGVPSQIFLMEPGGTTRKLTQMKRGASDPTWSPDGTQIAFAATRRREGDPRPDPDIFVIDADGNRLRRLAGTPRPDGHPDWSPDGSRVAFQSGFNFGDSARSEIWLAPVPDGIPTPLHLHTYRWGSDPMWSPDGRWIAYSRFAPGTINGEIPYVELVVIRPDGTQQHRIDDSYPYNKWRRNPTWSSNGRSIVFEDRFSVGIIDVDSGGLRNILTGTPRAQPSWGPDGVLVSLSPDVVATTPGVEKGWRPTWQPSWTRPDATVVLTGSGCEQADGAGVLHPGVLTLEFVNESYRDATFKVVRVPPGRRLDDLRAGSSIAGGWGKRNAPSETHLWSSPWEISAGMWAVVCFKDLSNGRGITLVTAGAVRIEVG